MTREEAREAIKEAYGNSEYTDEIIKALEQDLITKNNLGVDCISRAKAIEEADKLCLETGYDNEKVEEMLRELPPVTPIRSKGHWIGRKKVGFGEWKDVTVLVNLKGCVTDSCECSECGDWLTGSDEYECSARYCPNCGVKMESEVENGNVD